MLSAIEENAEKMRLLINGLLSFCRATVREIQKSDIDMVALVQNVIEEIKLAIGDRNVKFLIEDIPVAWGDPSTIRQVLVNLLSNALKYSRPQEMAKIEIGGTEKGGETIYYVKDNGIGFDEEHADKLFSLFHRLHSSEEFKGAGIGLAVVKRIIEKHDGRVWAERKVDKGATFYFSLKSRAHSE